MVALADNKPEYGSNEHESTLIIVTNEYERDYVCEWAMKQGKCAFWLVRTYDAFPFYVCVVGDTVTFTGSEYSQFYFKSFMEFVGDI